jgi:hypothetical protein
VPQLWAPPSVRRKMRCRLVARRSTCAGAWLMTVAVAAICCGGAGRAMAAKYTVIARKAAAFATDGARYAVWQRGSEGPGVVYDVAHHSTRRVAVPRLCTLADQEYGDGPAGAAGRFLLRCRSEGAVLDARTGAEMMLPSLGSFGRWNAMGARYVEGHVQSRVLCVRSPGEQKHGVPCVALYDFATGQVTYRARSQFGDLDRPGAPPICARLRARVFVQLEDASPESFLGYSDGVLAEVLPHRHLIRIERCSGHAKYISAHGEPENLDIRDGFLTWDTAHPGSRFGHEVLEPTLDLKRGALFRYRLATATLTASTLPRLPVEEQPEGVTQSRVLGYSTHAGPTVFWIATRQVSDATNTTEVVSSQVFMTR